MEKQRATFVTLVSSIALYLFISLCGFPAIAQGADPAVEARFADIMRDLATGRSNAAFRELERDLQDAKSKGDKWHLWDVYSMYQNWLYHYGRYQRASELATEGDINRYWDVTPETTQESLFLSARLQLISGAIDQAKESLHLILGTQYSLYSHLPRPVHRFAAIELARIEAVQGEVSNADARVRRVLSAALADKTTEATHALEVLFEAAKYFNETRRYSVAENVLSRVSHSVEKVRGYIPFFDSTLSSIEIANAFARSDSPKLAALVPKQEQVSALLDERPFHLELFDLYAKHHSFACREERLADDFDADLKKIVSRSPAMLQLRFTHIGLSMLMICAGKDAEALQALGQAKVTRAASPYEDLHLSLIEAYFAAKNGRAVAVAERLKEVSTQIQRAFEPFDKAGVGWPGSLRSDELSVLERIFEKLRLRSDSHLILADLNVAGEVFIAAQFVNREKSRMESLSQLARGNLKDEITKEESRSRERLIQTRNDYFDFMVDQLATLVEENFDGKTQKISDWPEGKQKEVNGVWIELAGLEFNIGGYDESLLRQVPQYFEATRQAPVRLREIQRSMAPGEAVVHASVIGRVRLSFCIRSNNVSINLASLDLKALDTALKLVKASLELPVGGATAQSSRFPVRAAGQLSETISSNLPQCIERAASLQIVPDPDWVNVPFMALPLNFQSVRGDFQNIDVKWLGLELPLVIQPSAAALLEARNLTPSNRQRKSLLSVSHPTLSPIQKTNTIVLASELFTTRGMVNTATLKLLPELPETLEEAQSIASLFPAGETVLLSGADASERELRSLDLRNYKIFHIASHALVAGEVGGIAEPGIVLTPGASNNHFNDGYLSLSEVYGLSLDADVVILSACNTAAADGRRSARGLTGLANAFFFAGARSVVASQWAVISQQAVPVISSFVSRMAADGMTPGASLNQAVRSYVSSSASDYLAHPRFWAVFVVVGGSGGAIQSTDASNMKMGQIRATEQIAREPRIGEVLNYEVQAEDGSGIALGMYFANDPSAPQVGSYLANVSPHRFEPFFRDEKFVARIVRASGRQLFVAGSYVAEKERRFELKSLSSDGRELWKLGIPTNDFAVPLDMIVLQDGVLAAFQIVDFYKTDEKNSISIVKISNSGKLLSRKDVPISKWFKEVFVNVKARFRTENELNVLMNEIVFQTKQTERFDTVLGAPKYRCGGRTQVAAAFQIETRSGEYRKLADFDRVALSGAVFDRNSGRMFFAGYEDLNCRHETTLKLFELVGDKLNLLMESRHGFGVRPNGISVSGQKVIVVGNLRIDVDYDPIRALKSRVSRGDTADRVNVDAASAEEYWDTVSQRYVGFQTTIDLVTGETNSATYLDNRSRSFISVATAGRNGWVGWGVAAGRSGWVVLNGF